MRVKDEEPKKENLETQWKNQETVTPYVIMEAKAKMISERGGHQAVSQSVVTVPLR